MSIPLVQNNEKDSINTSIIAIKRNIERINMLLGLVDSGSPDLSGLATKQELEDAITQVETDLAPADEVTSGNMHSVTSNAVAEELDKIGTISSLNFTEMSLSAGANWSNYQTVPKGTYIGIVKVLASSNKYISDAYATMQGTNFSQETRGYASSGGGGQLNFNFIVTSDGTKTIRFYIYNYSSATGAVFNVRLVKIKD